MSLLDNLPDLCQIARVVRSVDSFGGNLYAVEIEQSDVECWMMPASDSEIQQFEKRGQAVTVKVYFSSNPSITERSRILITERQGVAQANLDITDPANPDTLEVMSVSQPDASAGLSILWRVMCRNNTGPSQ